MKIDDLKKGTRVKQSNGWEATLLDSKKGTIRNAEVYGICTEAGSIYSHNIVAYKGANGDWHNDMEYSQSQQKCKEMNAALFGD